MRRWNSIIEIIYFPLEVLYIASLLFGLSSILLGQSFSALFNINSTLFITLIDMIRALTVWLIQAFPLLLLLKGVYRRHEDGLVVVAGFLGYVAFHMGTAFFIPTNMVPEAYGSSLGLSIPASQLVSQTSLNVLHTGLPGAILVLLITRFMVDRLKKRSPYSLFSFVDKHVSVVFVTLGLSLLAGILSGLAAPFFVVILQNIFTVLSSNLNNPVNLFVYGILDRILSIFGYANWMHQQFWFTTMGGTWSNAMGSVAQGDISIWTSQLAQNIYGFSAGKLITPYYILNIFAIPAFVLASYQTYTDRLVRARLLFFVVIAVLASGLFGTLLPIEVFLLATTPLLFVFHLVVSGLLFAVLPTLGANLGYAFNGSVVNANPGTILDALILIRNANLQKTLLILLFVGMMVFLAYYAVSTYYYRKGAVGLVYPQERDVLIQELLESIGGLENIKLINASIGKLIIQVNNRDLVDFKKIHHRVTKIVETKAGYAISYGSSSYMLWHLIVSYQSEAVKSA